MLTTLYRYWPNYLVQMLAHLIEAPEGGLPLRGEVGREVAGGEDRGVRDHARGQRVACFRVSEDQGVIWRQTTMNQRVS